jgi:dTDP-4-amino-4,6-dideoxygalactose transaminase
MIKFYDLQRINAQHADELKQAAGAVIDTGQYIQGAQVKRFEQSLAKQLGVKYAIGVGNGLDALKLIIRAYIEMGAMQPGDEIILPANTFIATALAITENGLKPVLVDVNIDTYNINIAKIESHITPRTRAIIIVHLYGHPCWDNELVSLAEQYKLKIIEDAAQAYGACIGQRQVGHLGHAAAFSFYPTKPLACLGDGGAVVTDDEILADYVHKFSNYGGVKYLYLFKGVNSRLDELQAAFLNVKLKYAAVELAVRRGLAGYYWHTITNSNVKMPPYDEQSAWHQFVIRTDTPDQRDSLQRYLKLNEVETMIHYPVPIHKQAAFKEFDTNSIFGLPLDLPVTERLSETILSLPISPVMTYQQAVTVAKLINAW